MGPSLYGRPTTSSRSQIFTIRISTTFFWAPNSWALCGRHSYLGPELSTLMGRRVIHQLHLGTFTSFVHAHRDGVPSNGFQHCLPRSALMYLTYIVADTEVVHQLMVDRLRWIHVASIDGVHQPVVDRLCGATWLALTAY
jgi:hypothetical protein